ncbi:MAG: mandelate racemase/muconate lactonizing enzyme family protein [Enterocloster sp.]
MKITDIKTHIMRAPLTVPLRISLGLITHAVSCLVEVETDEGITGYGEGSPGALITGENLEGTMETVRVLKNDLIGTDPRDLEAVYTIMNRTVAHAGTAKAAIDIACHDILGKSCGLPLYRLLGGLSNEIETDMTVGIDKPEIIAQRAAEHVKAGFKVIKTKVGGDIRNDLACVKAIREAVGDDVKIRLDANQGWNGKEAVELIKRLDEYDIELVEQPVPRFDFEGLKYVTANSRVPIMADESCWDSKDALRLVSERAVDIINIKLMKCGGLYEAKKIVNLAEAAGITCMLGCMAEESGIAINAAAALGAALGSITRADLDATFSLNELPYEGGFRVLDTCRLVLPEEPGLGIKKLKEHMME